MARREFQGDFSSGDVEGASYERRPDAVSRSYLQALSPGPRVLNDPTEGLLVKGWYARADNTAGKVYVCPALDDIRLGWGSEIELFSYAGDDLVEIDFAFDQNGAPLLVAERTDGHIWIRYFKPAVSGFVFEDFGAGSTPRVILDDPVRVDDSDLVVFFKNGGTLQYREQSDLYVTPTDTTIPLTASQHLEGTVRDKQNRIHVIISTRTTGTGTWALTRETSDLYPFYLPPESLTLNAEALSGEILVTLIKYSTELDEVELANSAVSGDLAVLVWPEPVADHLEVAAEVDSVDIILVTIPYEPDPEALDVANAAISGTVVVVVIEYEPDPESLDVGNSSVSGTITVP